MGEVGQPTAARRAATLDLARRHVAAVANDEAPPEPLDRASCQLDREAAVFRLAQDLAAVYDAPEPKVAAVAASRLFSGEPGVELITYARSLTTDDARRIAGALLRAADEADARGKWLP